MAPDEPRGARPGPVVLRIKLRYDDVEAMIQRFAPNVGKTGLFLPTKSLQPLGAEIKFELRLATDQPVLVGLGRVKAVREPDPDNPKATFGMAVELTRVTRESRDLILKMLERRKQLGLPETGLPMPADIDAARRSDFIDTGIKDYASGAIPQPVPAADSAPSTSEPLLTSPRRASGPIAVAKVAVLEPLPPEPPRKKRVPVADLIASASGPIATATTSDGLDEDVDVAAVLARARALAGSDLDGELEALRDSAAAPIEIGIEAASAELARQLGGAAVRRDRSAGWAPPPPTASDARDVVAPESAAEPAPAAAPVDAKAEARDDVAPAPAAAPIDAKADARDDVAPAPVARPVDAKADARDDAAPAPAATAVEAKAELRDDAAPAPAAEPDDEPTPIVAFEPVPTPDDDDEALFEPPSRRSFAPDNASIITEPSTGLIHDGADAARFEDDGAHEVDPEQIHDEIHRLDEGDFEEVERTVIGQMPVDPQAFDQHAYATMPAEQAALADRLDAQLAEAEHEDLGFSETVDARILARSGGDTLEPATVDAGQSGGFSLEEPPASGDFVIPLGHQASNEDPYGRLDSLEAALAAAVNEEEDIEEIDDFEILAEADAEDADLLASAAEQEVSGNRQLHDAAHDVGTYDAGAHDAAAEEPAYEAPPARPSFLSRLELDDDSGYHTPPAAGELDEFSHEPGEIDPRLLSAGHALRAFEEPEEPGDFNEPGTFTPVPNDPYAQPVGEQSYTFAGDIPPDEFDAPHGNYQSNSSGFVAPDAFDQSDVISIRPATPQQRQAEEDFPDLESALEALDVDLDDLGGAPPGGRRNAPSARRNPTGDVPTSRGRSEANLGTSPTEGAGVRRKPGRMGTPAPKPGRAHKRATTEDGILIDFDDEE